ncbi:hypothetical protein FDECE_9460 [Fusarium decemcellulare]|nr:hypothetical protein FDECE_9460 [Fusarium decemcellulare]
MAIFFSSFLLTPSLLLGIATPSRTDRCTGIPAPIVPGTEAITISASTTFNLSINGIDSQLTRAAPSGVDACVVNVTLTHPGVGDTVSFEIWLPLHNWNNRFQAVGGGGWAAGSRDSLVYAAYEGYATGTTYGGGLSDDGGTLNDVVFSSPGVINLGVLADFSSRALHELSIIGKAVATSYYGVRPAHSYWNGCSTGGRQGYMLAQRYPDDFDGILANAPALYWPSLLLAVNWPQFVMRQVGYFPTPCEFETFQNASIRACDSLDGVVDGIINNPSRCNFDPYKLVGSHINCDGGITTINSQAAEIVKGIHEGPHSSSGQRLWDGYEFGTSYAGAALTETINGVTGPVPFTASQSWITVFLKQDANFNMSTLTTLEQFTELFATSNSQYGGFIGTDIPDLAAFRDRGGKLVTWHGLADQLIMVNNTLRYRETVERVMGGNDAVNSFYRLFLAPGVDHCQGGYGPIPQDPLQSVVDWVERGIAPETLSASFLNANGTETTGKLCLWPRVAHYDGVGDINRAESYTCTDSYYEDK